MIKLLISVSKRPPVPGWSLVGPFDGADLQADLAGPLPLADGTVAAVYLHHTLEHLSPQRSLDLLFSLQRLIQPGGMRDSADCTEPFEGGLIRIAVPDLSAATRAYSERDDEFFARVQTPLWPDAPLGARFGSWLYGDEPTPRRQAFDHETLVKLLKQAGFGAMYRSAFRKSLRRDLCIEGLDPDGADLLFMECWREATAARRAA